MSHKKCHDGYNGRNNVENAEKRSALRPKGPDLEKEIKKDHKNKSKEALKHEKQRHRDVKKELHNERKHWKQLDSYAREVKFKDLEENGFYCKTLENACVQCNLEPIPGSSQDPDWICENCQDEDLDREMQYSDIDIQEVNEERRELADQVQIAPEPSSEMSTESSSELIWRSLLTDEEWMNYLVEKKRMEKEKAEHIRKLKEEHQIWKQKQREDHEEFKRKQKEAHKEWKKRQKQEHYEWRKKLKMNREEAKRKTKKPEHVPKKNDDESPDSADSDDSEDEEDDEMPRHKIVPWRKNHDVGFIRSIRNVFHHAARSIYRATGARRTWKYFKKKIIRRYLRRTYRNVSRQITSFLEMFDTQVGNALILLGLLILGVFLGGYLYSHLHRIN